MRDPLLFTESFEYLLETGFQNWMTEALSNMKIDNVQAEYRPSDINEPIIWTADSRLLVIHEPDPFHAALLFLGWVASELPKQWKQVWENLQQIEHWHGKEAAETVLKDYINEMDNLELGPGLKALK